MDVRLATFLLASFALLLFSPAKASSQACPPFAGDMPFLQSPHDTAGGMPLSFSQQKSLPGSPALRVPVGVFENLPNQRSNVELFVSNYGIIGLNVVAGSYGGTWPRGSGNPYIFGGGFWFGAKKIVNGEARMLTEISYNPLTGSSWFVPGRIQGPYEQSKVETTPEAINNYRLYSSIDYNPVTGEPFDPNDKGNNGANWPFWNSDPSQVPGRDRYFGDYVADPADRNRADYPGGPVIIGDEEMVSVFKDTDLSRYEIGEISARGAGYPLGLQVEQQVFFCDTGRLQDVVIIRYRFINMSDDTLHECFVAPVYDIDIGHLSNDRLMTVIPERHNDSLDLGIVWSETSGGDENYGYLGVDILESPAVYPAGHEEAGYLRKDKVYFDNAEQLGLHTLRNWVFDIEPNTPEERYRFISSGDRDGDNGPGDKKIAVSTGPFNMRPGDTVVTAVALIFVPSGAGGFMGRWEEDLKPLVDLDMYVQAAYDGILKTSSVEGRSAWRNFGELDLW